MYPRRSATPFSDLLRTVRWLHEFPRPSRGAVNVLAGYPAPYRVGMSNLGFHFLLRRLMSSPLFRVERFFADTAPLTLESGAGISSAELIFVSISYEEDYLNLVRILMRAGVPPLREERRRRPLIIAGGPACSANPYPLADIVDCCVLGEGEESLDDIVGIIAREPHADPGKMLELLAGLPAVFAPAVSSGAAYPSPAGAFDFPHSIVVTPRTVFSNVLLIEIGRGCPGSCSFCIATALYRPYRAMPVDDIERLLDSITDPPAAAGLVSTAVAAHPRFGDIVRACTARGMRVALGSIRAEDIDGEKAELIGSTGTRSVSFAPESGSEALRFRLGKRVPNTTYIRAAAALSAAGVRNFNLYFLVGCPGETDGDVRETVEFLSEFHGAAAGRRMDPASVPRHAGGRGACGTIGAVETFVREAGHRGPDKVGSVRRAAGRSLRGGRERREGGCSVRRRRNLVEACSRGARGRSRHAAPGEGHRRITALGCDHGTGEPRTPRAPLPAYRGVVAGRTRAA